MNNNSLSKINKYLCFIIVVSTALLLVACSGDVKRLGDSERFLYKNVTNTPSSYKGKYSYNEKKVQMNESVSLIESVPEMIVIIVEQGDDIYSISRQYDVSVDRISRQNLINYPYKLRIGQKIIIASGNDNSDPYVENNKKIIITKDDVYVVKSGDSLSLISNKYDIDIKLLSSFNNINNPGMIYIGQELSIPKASQQYDFEQRKSVNSAFEEKTQGQILTDINRSNVRENNFRWPVRGRIIYDFSDLVNGEKNQGVNISVPVGSSVKAAENGKVVFSGEEEGLGKLVLISHSNGWVTAYMHLSQYSVQRGDVVSRGQIIAKSGKGDNFDTPQLHFEIRKDSVSVNPTDYLPK